MGFPKEDEGLKKACSSPQDLCRPQGQRAFLPGPVHIDDDAVLPLLDNPDRLISLKPFLDPAPYVKPRDSTRPGGVPCRLLAVAMMREGDKLASYRALAAALTAVRSGYRALAPSTGTITNTQTNKGSSTVYQQTQLANYQAALSRLVG